MVDLGRELLAPEKGANGKEVHLTIEPDSPETTALLRDLRVFVQQLPATIEAAVQRALTAQNLARTTQVSVDAPDLSRLEELVASMPQAATAQEVRDAVASVVSPPRKVKRVVNRDAWGRIESVTEEDQ